MLLLLSRAYFFLNPGIGYKPNSGYRHIQTKTDIGVYKGKAIANAKEFINQTPLMFLFFKSSRLI